MDYPSIKSAHIASETAMRANLANRLAHADFLEWESLRQKAVIRLALEELGKGNDQKATEILKQLTNPCKPSNISATD